MAFPSAIRAFSKVYADVSAPFSLRRSFVALSTRPLVRALLMVIARILFFVKKMPLKNFSERSEPREPNGRHGRSRDSGFE
jgi:hypothetical protein